MSSDPRKRAISGVAGIGDIVGCGIHNNDGFADQIERASNGTVLEAPTDPFDGLGNASAILAVSLRCVWLILACLRDVLGPHREMEPVEHMMSETGAGRFAERSWTVGTIAQDGDRCR
jgi:hypothetical protein